MLVIFYLYVIILQRRIPHQTKDRIPRYNFCTISASRFVCQTCRSTECIVEFIRKQIGHSSDQTNTALPRALENQSMRSNISDIFFLRCYWLKWNTSINRKKLFYLFLCFFFSHIHTFHRDLRREDVIQRAHYMAYNKYDKIRVNKHTFSSVIYTSNFLCLNTQHTHRRSTRNEKHRHTLGKKRKRDFHSAYLRNSSHDQPIKNKFQLKPVLRRRRQSYGSRVFNANFTFNHSQEHSHSTTHIHDSHTFSLHKHNTSAALRLLAEANRIYFSPPKNDAVAFLIAP